MSRRKQNAPCKVQETISNRAFENRLLEDDKVDQVNCEADCSSQKNANPATNVNDLSGHYWNANTTVSSQPNDETKDLFISTANCENGEPLNLCKSKNNDDFMAGKSHEEEGERESAILEDFFSKIIMPKQDFPTGNEIHRTRELKSSIPNLDFTLRSEVASHQTLHQKKSSENIEMSENDTPCDSPVFQKFKLFSGFKDLSFVDFSCNKFSVISEDVCSKAFHRLTDRDSKHFFLCKTCDRLFPTLSSLECHSKKHDQLKKKTLLSCEDKLNNEEEISSNKTAITHFLGLEAVTECKEKVLEKNLTYSMDNSEVKTSPDFSSVNVPPWMKTSISDDCFYDTEISRESSDIRPPLKLKLVRRRTVGEEGKPLLVPSQYFIEDETDVLSSGWDQATAENAAREKSSASRFQCDTCGESFHTANALSGHRASSICGIGVGCNSNGRRMYWCRLCNYVSCEKSTILRHQRTHTGLRPYSCKFCEIAFTTKANCERHIRKRHRLRVSNDMEVKKSVFCDYDLLRKARDGEINVPPSATISNPGGKYFSFVCRICKAAFSSRSNGARHVMAKHSIMNRKKANEAIVCDRTPLMRSRDSTSPPPDRGLYREDDKSDRGFASTLIKKHDISNSSSQNKESFSVKIPQLIPLAKIRAHHKASLKLADKFHTEYDQVFQAIQRMRQDGGSLSSKLLSLIGSASAILKRKSSSHSSFTPVDAMNPSPMFATNPADESIDLEIGQELGKAPTAVDYDRYDDSAEPYTNGQSFFDDDEENNLPSKNTFTNGEFSSVSSPSESPFPWKPTSSSLLLRHFAARSSEKERDDISMQDDMEGTLCESANDADLSSVGELMSFLKSPPPLSTQNDSSNLKSASKLTLSSMSNNKLFDLSAKQVDSSYSSFDKNRYSWQHPGPPARLRDERGRYIRNPNSPRPKLPKIKSISPYPGHSDLPTMVPLRDGKVNLDGLKLMSKKGSSFSCGISVKGRKCPKCDKVFPWASSLSRHIMTHTGLKPYMCAKCSMRFTTRSNLLRHAYRRHNLVRGSNERHNVLLTLPLAEQKKHAEREAQRMAEIGEVEAQRIAEAEDQFGEDEQVDQQHTEYGNDLEKLELDAVSKEANEEEGNHYNKRYMCGLCKLPFANRSNLVRHLHRLHQITKDDPEFRGLLIKLQTSKPMKFKFNKHPRAFVPIKPAPFRQKSDQALLDDGNSPSSVSPSPSMLNGFGSEVNAGKLKPFTCSICYIGFTKRNNAARHMQHQHNISRKSATFHQLIIRNDVPLADTSDVKEENHFNNEKHTFDEVGLKKAEEAEVRDDPARDANSSVDMETELTTKEKEASFLSSETTSATTQDKPISSLGNRRRSMTWRKMEEDTGEDVGEQIAPMRQHKKKDIRLTHFICGVCKRIFKEVADLKVHLDEHNIPHPWHCTVCGVPFTNKYNCQRHLMRRHGISDLEPKYVEDLRHGPPQPRKRSRGIGRGKNAYAKARAGPK